MADESIGSTITLNKTPLANAIQEFIAAKIYHEVLHVFINNIEANEDNGMANNVLAKIQTLQAWFLILTPDARALA